MTIPKPTKYWIKLWLEILHDDKMGALSDNLWRRTIECFLMAGKIDAGGRLPTLRRMAWITHQTEGNMIDQLEILKKLGIIGQDDEGYFVVNFEKRQAAVSPARRMQEYRKRQETLRDSYASVTPSVTDASPRGTEEQSITTTTAATRITDYVIKNFSPNGRVSSDTAGLVQSLLDNHTEADIIYAVGEAERKTAATNDPPTLEYITAICERRKRGEPDKATKKRSKKNGVLPTEPTQANPPDDDEWERLLKA